MGRVITGTDFPPSAMLRVEGASLTGIMQGSKDIKTQYGMTTVFSLRVLDATCAFTKNKEAYEPAEGEIIEVGGTTMLTRQLNQVKAGEKVLIKYAGLGKKTKGNAPHLFHVEVL